MTEGSATKGEYMNYKISDEGVVIMSADNWLFIEKKEPYYRLSERAGNGEYEIEPEEFRTLEAAVKAAKKRMDRPMPEGDYEYGLQLGRL